MSSRAAATRSFCTIVGLVALFLFTGSLSAVEESTWHSALGDESIQYRWRHSGTPSSGFCTVEFRDLRAKKKTTVTALTTYRKVYKDPIGGPTADQRDFVYIIGDLESGFGRLNVTAGCETVESVAAKDVKRE